jgi:hypothetical protein
MTNVKFITWDWKGGPVAWELVAAVNSFTRGPIYAVQVDNGDADPMIAFSDEPLTSQQAYALWVAE